MTRAPHIPEAQRLADQPGTAGELLREAAAFEPPFGAQARIWRQLNEAAARMADVRDESPVVTGMMRMAAGGHEPPPGARERIWRRLVEEQAVRNGAEPRRLRETDDFVAGLLASAEEMEPGFGKQARIYRHVRPSARPVRWGLPVGFAAVAASLLLLLHFRGEPPAAPLTRPAAPAALALTLPAMTDLRVVGSPAGSLTVGGRLVVGDSSSARVQLAGVGDLILGGAGTSLALLQADDHGVRLELAQGRVSVHAAKRFHAAPLVIHARDTDVEVVGTVFSVESSAEGARVYVQEGLVQVRTPSGTSFVGAGQVWPDSEKTIAPWAAAAMGTLVGALVPEKTLASREPIPPATGHRESAKVKSSRHAPPPEPPRAPKVDVAPKPATPFVAPPVPAAPEPPSAPHMKQSVTRYSGVRSYLMSIDPEVGASLSALREQREQLAGGGNVTEKIRVDYGIAGSAEADAPTRAGALADLANELYSVGAIRESIDMREKIVRIGSLPPDVRARALVEALAGYVVLDEAHGLRLADDGLDWMPEGQRAAALVLIARLRANHGDATGSDEALLAALAIDRAAVDGAAATLQGLALRAQFLPEMARTVRQIATEIRVTE